MKWTRSPWSVGDRLPPQRPQTTRAPLMRALLGDRGRSSVPPSSVATASPQSKHDNSIHFVRRMRAPRSINFVDIDLTVAPSTTSWQSGITPTGPRTLVPDRAGSGLEYLPVCQR